MKNYHDYMVRGTSVNEEVLAFALTSKDLVETAMKTHSLSPIPAAALGRSLSGAVLMAGTMKGENDTLTLEFRGDGPLRSVVAQADSKGNVRGYTGTNYVDLPPNEAMHLNVGGAIGKGTLTVIKDLHMKEPYSSSINLRSGEIAEDLAYYYATSEQTPSSCGLGVLFEKDGTIKAAGGFLIQLLPNASEETISALEESLSEIKNVTDVLLEEMTPEHLLEKVLGPLGFKRMGDKEIHLACHCSKERSEQTLLTLGKEELKKLAEEAPTTEIHCEFCESNYVFTSDELLSLSNKCSK
ncbi:MAG: Hsp33 family molecular chaperone HslO [Bacilli bacterium]|nr:Hsp33 family molecular chaperone HslO [Bacilli bacterium]